MVGSTDFLDMKKEPNRAHSISVYAGQILFNLVYCEFTLGELVPDSVFFNSVFVSAAFANDSTFANDFDGAAFYKSVSSAALDFEADNAADFSESECFVACFECVDDCNLSFIHLSFLFH